MTSPGIITTVVALGTFFLPTAGLMQDTSIPKAYSDQLQAIADQIKACKEEDITPTDATAKQQSPVRLLDGPPLNVTWDIKRSDSLVKPFFGVIEFSTYARLWAPEALMRKNQRVADLVNNENAAPVPTKHVYTFEISNGSMRLTKLMQASGDQKEQPEPKTYRCWQIAAGVKRD